MTIRSTIYQDIRRRELLANELLVKRELQIQELRELNDELLEGLKLAERYVDTSQTGGYHARKTAKRIIAKAGKSK